MDYELVKSGEHPIYRFVKEFYEVNHTDMRRFLKYYNCFKQSGKTEDLLPCKHGPKYNTRRPSQQDEEQVLELRRRGCNKFEIASQLKQKANNFMPSPSGYIYNILKRHEQNRLKVADKEEKRKIIKNVGAS